MLNRTWFMILVNKYRQSTIFHKYRIRYNITSINCKHSVTLFACLSKTFKSRIDWATSIQCSLANPESTVSVEYICLFVCLSVCLPVYLSICRSATQNSDVYQGQMSENFKWCFVWLAYTEAANYTYLASWN